MVASVRSDGVLKSSLVDAPKDYSKRVAAAMRAMRLRAGLNTSQMAGAISDELGRLIRPKDVSRWEGSTHTPKADVFYAVMQISGVSDPTKPDTSGTLWEQAPRLRRMFEQALSDHGLISVPLSPLPPEHRSDFLTVLEAAKLRGVSKQTVYHWIEVKRLPAYLWLGKRVVVRADVERVEVDPDS